MAAFKVVLIGLLAATSVLATGRGNKHGEKHVSFEITSDKFETCPQYRNLKNTIVNLTLWNPPDEDVLYISGSLVIQVPLDGSEDYKYITKLKRCVRKDWSTCEKYLEYEVKEMCEELPKKDSVWAATVKKFQQFNPNCPIQPGAYNFEDAPIDISGLAKMEIAEGNWQIELRAVYKGEVIFCVVGNTIIRRKPNKRRS